MSEIDQLTKDWAEKEGFAYWHAETTASTNDIAKEEALKVNDEFKLYVTGHQSQGRGRGEHSWSDNGMGSSLLSSWRFNLNHSPQHIMGPIIGLAVFRAAQKIWPNLGWSLKAPNDLYLNDQKVAGLLIESLSQGDQYRIVVGIGMNVFGHPKDIENATHLTEEIGDGGELPVEKWQQFLSTLKSSLTEAVLEGTREYISDSSREELLTALNSNPRKEAVYIEVTESGDLVTENGTVSWHDL